MDAVTHSRSQLCAGVTWPIGLIAGSGRSQLCSPRRHAAWHVRPCVWEFARGSSELAELVHRFYWVGGRPLGKRFVASSVKGVERMRDGREDQEKQFPLQTLAPLVPFPRLAHASIFGTSARAP